MTVQVKGLDKLLRKISNPRIIAAVKPVLKAGALQIKGRLADYPKATSANSPEQLRWYQRGYGPRWRRSDGTLGGRKTSETLGKKWTIKSEAAGMRQVVGNNVSYGPYVQSDELQAGFHKDRGWVTDKEAVEKEQKDIIKQVKRAIDGALSD